MKASRRLVIATRNDKKLLELKRYLKGVSYEVASLKEYRKVPRIVENGDTFKKNAIKKAQRISRFVKGLAVGDDSGLVVTALNGAPGIRSSRFAGPGKRDKDNNRKLLRLMSGVPLNKRKAYFVCAAAICDNGKVVKIIEERCAGLIAFEPKGSYGFGYDPLFLIPRYNKTFGQLGLKVKDRMSHRSKALKKVRNFLRNYL